MPWLIGFAVVGVLGYLAYERVVGAAKALGNNLASSFANGVGITTINIDQTTIQGDLGQFGLGPNDSLVINTYAPPAGYSWGFSAGPGLKKTTSTAMSATFTPDPAMPAASVPVQIALWKTGATVSPLAIFKLTATISQPTAVAAK